MNTLTAIAKVVSMINGGQSGLARKLGIAPQSVQLWVSSGFPPKNRVMAISAITGWKVTPHELAPDIYPNPNDGLPPAITKKRHKAA